MVPRLPCLVWACADLYLAAEVLSRAPSPSETTPRGLLACRRRRRLRCRARISSCAGQHAFVCFRWSERTHTERRIPYDGFHHARSQGGCARSCDVKSEDERREPWSRPHQRHATILSVSDYFHWEKVHSKYQGSFRQSAPALFHAPVFGTWLSLWLANTSKASTTPCHS
jgi:hypothetical protein